MFLSEESNKSFRLQDTAFQELQSTQFNTTFKQMTIA